MNKFQIEDLLIDLNLIGIENLFAIRGDIIKDNFSDKNFDFTYHKNSAGLVRQIKQMNEGKYLYQSNNTAPTDFCIGVAAYPEKHYESPNMCEDLKYLKEKVDSGADFIITQMVFDIKVVKNFIQKLKMQSINVPIIIGIKPIVSLKSLYDLPRRFFINIPENFIKKMQQAKSKEEEFKIGTKYMAKYIQKLLELKVDGIHIFTMGKGDSTKALLKQIYY
jgi:methylenetetrahydrofolate reductase (NADPH)